MGAVWKLPAKWLPGFFFRFNILILIYFFKYETIETHARAFLPLNILSIGTVMRYVKKMSGFSFSENSFQMIFSCNAMSVV